MRAQGAPGMCSPVHCLWRLCGRGACWGCVTASVRCGARRGFADVPCVPLSRRRLDTPTQVREEISSWILAHTASADKEAGVAEGGVQLQAAA